MNKLRGQRSDRPIYDECGDVRLMSETQRLAWLKNLQDAKIQSVEFTEPLIFGTSGNEKNEIK